jgi:hypothetical protein
VTGANEVLSFVSEKYEESPDILASSYGKASIPKISGVLGGDCDVEREENIGILGRVDIITCCQVM